MIVKEDEMVRRIRTIAFVCVCLFSIGLIALGITLEAAQQVPEYYQVELSRPSEPEITIAKAAEFEQTVNDLGEAIQHEGDWSVVLSEDQVNAWLETELETQFPQLMHSDITDPRIHVEGNRVHLACQYWRSETPIVVSLELEPFVTQWPNVIGVKIHQAKIGAVPANIGLAVNQIARGARRSRIKMKWGKVDQTPAAVLQIPDRLLSEKRMVALKQIGLADGKLQVVGVTLPVPDEAEVSTARRESK